MSIRRRASAVIHRRHLTPSQRSMVGARAKSMYAAQAKERMKAGGGDKKSAAAKSGTANLPDPIKGDARDQAARAVGVSGKSIDHCFFGRVGFSGAGFATIQLFTAWRMSADTDSPHASA